MIFQKKKSEGIAWWIISLDLGNGQESEEFVENSEENVIEKIRDLIEEREPVLDEDQNVSHKLIDYITVAKVVVLEVKYPTTKAVIQLK